MLNVLRFIEIVRRHGCGRRLTCDSAGFLKKMMRKVKTG